MLKPSLAIEQTTVLVFQGLSGCKILLDAIRVQAYLDCSVHGLIAQTRQILKEIASTESGEASIQASVGPVLLCRNGPKED
jgi:hypothetical protein